MLQRMREESRRGTSLCAGLMTKLSRIRKITLEEQVEMLPLREQHLYFFLVVIKKV